MRSLLALLLAALATGCGTAPTIPDASPGVAFSKTRGGASKELEERVGKARVECTAARKDLRKEARSLERRHNLMATLGASFGASGGAAALGATADADKGVKNTLTITGAVLAVAGAVATGLSSKDSDLLSRLQERALKIKGLESELDELVAERNEAVAEGASGPNDEKIRKKLADLEEECAQP